MWQGLARIKRESNYFFDKINIDTILSFYVNLGDFIS